MKKPRNGPTKSEDFQGALMWELCATMASVDGDADDNGLC
jgi:hypothetical protein